MSEVAAVSFSLYCAGGGRIAAKERADNFGGVHEGLRRQVGVTLGHANLGMPEKPL